jgi:hypothetical protein
MSEYRLQIKQMLNNANACNLIFCNILIFNYIIILSEIIGFNNTKKYKSGNKKIPP